MIIKRNALRRTGQAAKTGDLDNRLELKELAADPPAPAANTCVIYVKDVAGKTGLYVRFPTGAVQQIKVEA